MYIILEVLNDIILILEFRSSAIPQFRKSFEYIEMLSVY